LISGARAELLGYLVARTLIVPGARIAPGTNPSPDLALGFDEGAFFEGAVLSLANC